MGNTPPTRLRLSNGDHSYSVQLGGSAALYIGGREVKLQGNGEITESRQVSYKVDNSTCLFRFTNTVGNIMNPPHHDKKLDIKIIDDVYGYGNSAFHLSVTVQIDKAGFLDTTICTNFQMISEIPLGPGTGFQMECGLESYTIGASGGVTQNSFDFYGLGRMRGLMVREWRRKTGKEKPYMVTVAHYYANNENGKDIGLSVALKRIRVSDDGYLDFAVDGPEQHPVRALLYMFDEVRRTGTWEPTYCPHCANSIVQRQRAGMFSQSESEDSDIDNVPAALPRGRRENAGGGIVANDGRFRGNNNGNLNIRNLILGL